MDFNRGRSPEAVVAARPTGVNGIPETFVDSDMLDSTSDIGRGADTARMMTGRSADAYLPWLALGAVVAGGLGAIAALRRHPARGQMPAQWRPDSHSVTPPHGDILPRHR